MAKPARSGRRRGRVAGLGARLAAVVGGVVIVVGLVAQPMLAPGPTPSGASATPAASSSVAPEPSAGAVMDALLARVRSVYFEIYDADLTAGSADDLTPPRLDLILEGAASPDAADEVAILGLLTTVILDLTATELELPTDGDRICPDGVVDVASIPGATDVFGVDDPRIAGVVANLIGNWDGTLGNDGRTWTFRYGEPQAATVLAVLEGMTDGRLIVDAGCPG